MIQTDSPLDIRAEGIAGLYPRLLEMIMSDGRLVSPRGFRTKEITSMRLSVDDMTNNILVHPVRNLNYRFMVAEWCWIMAGRDDLATLVKYNKKYTEFSDDGKTLTGAYGPRIRGTDIPWLEIDNVQQPGHYYDQLGWAVAQLKRSSDTRQAVVNLWEPPCPVPSKDIPCTLSLQFLIRKDSPHVHGGIDFCHCDDGPTKLEMIVTMRSSDAWLGIPYDFFTFSMLGNCVAGELGVLPGSITFQLGSSHLYDCDWANAAMLINRWEEMESVRSPSLGGLPAKSLFDYILDNNHRLAVPWQYYQDALHQHTKQEALDVLRSIK
jgi:thymidylate synthase